MERFCPEDHDSLVCAEGFETDKEVTQKLGLSRPDFSELTVLYLAEYTLMQENRRLTGNRYQQLWERLLPRRIYNCMYRLSIRELPENIKTRQYVAEEIHATTERLPFEDQHYSGKLREAVVSLLAKGIIETKGYKLSITDDNIDKIRSERIGRVPLS